MNRAQILEWAGTRISPPHQRYILLAIASLCDTTSHDAKLTHGELTVLTCVRGAAQTEAVRALWERYLIDVTGDRRGVITYHLRIEGDTAP